MKTQASSRNPTIDLLRAGCVLYIVGFWHLMTYTPLFPGYHNGVTTRLTVVALALFMFISGLCVGASFLRDGGQARAFYRKRLLRIYPLFFLAALLFLALGLANGAALVRALLLISPLWGKQPMTLWFIANLCLYYLLLPLLMRQGPGSRRFWLLALGVEAVFAAAPLFSGTDHRTALYFPAFCLGLHFAARPAPVLWPWAIVAAAGVGLSALADGDPEQALASIPMALSLPVLIHFACSRQLGQRELPRLVAALAYAGFAAYLLHRVAFTLLGHALAALPDEARLLGFVLAGVPLIFALSYLIQRSYDRRLAKRTR